MSSMFTSSGLSWMKIWEFFNKLPIISHHQPMPTPPAVEVCPTSHFSRVNQIFTIREHSPAALLQGDVGQAHREVQGPLVVGPGIILGPTRCSPLHPSLKKPSKKCPEVLAPTHCYQLILSQSCPCPGQAHSIKIEVHDLIRNCLSYRLLIPIMQNHGHEKIALWKKMMLL